MYFSKERYQEAYSLVKSYAHSIYAYRKAQGRELSDVDLALHGLATEAICDMDRARDGLGIGSKRLAEKLGQVSKGVMSSNIGENVNSLGEVQGMGGEVDRMAALYVQAQKMVISVSFLISALEIAGDFELDTKK